MSETLSRRAVLTGAVHGTLPEEETFDVVVVGSGAAGLAAALEARKAGAEVIVLEKMGSIGGNSVISQGLAAVPGTPQQSEAGIGDNPELMFNDLIKVTKISHPHRIALLTENALATWQWTIDELGVHWSRGVEYDYGHSVRRCVALANQGEALMNPLAERVSALGVSVRLNTRVTGFLTDDTGRVTGVTAHVTDAAGLHPVTIKARKAVVAAAGGFGADIAMRQMQSWRLGPGISTTTQPGSTSEVIRALSDIGAWVIHMQYIHCMPEACADEKGWGSAWKFNQYCAATQGLWVVQETGRRFVNETADNTTRTNAVLGVISAGEHCLAVADARAAAHPRSALFKKSDVEALVQRGFVLKYATLSELASDLGVPLIPLQDEISRINETLAANDPNDYLGRVLSPTNELIGEGPWYACRFAAKVQLCGGGVAIDSQARVLSVTDDAPVPGLFAAGEITGGLNGEARLSSCGLIDALTVGRIAGRNAAAA